MKVLVATKETQGMRPNDSYSVSLRSSEIVVPPIRLEPGWYADDEDGYARVMYGIYTYGSVTTMKVMDIPISISELEYALEQTLRREFPDLATNYAKRARQQVQRMVSIASVHRLGAVLEFRDNLEAIRKVGVGYVSNRR